jgi:hypothetical protein
MSVYLSLEFNKVVTSFAEMGDSRKGPVFGPLDSVNFLYDKICADEFEFYFDDKGCVVYEGRKYNNFLSVGEMDVDLERRLVDYDKELNGSLKG